MRFRQRGLGGTLVAVVLIVIAVGVLATLALSRIAKTAGQGGEVAVRFSNLHAGLAQYVTANGRLPCPANPAADDGLEIPGAAGTCTYPEGTVPWRTIGARRDDGIDPWSAKISYRVYTGAAGSLTQAGGASMVQCDSVDTAPAPATALVGSEGRLCRPDTRVTLRNTPPASFLAGKGLSVNDSGSNLNDVAYVLVSHGPTGLGGYTTAGIRRDLPAAGPERNNTGPTGPFTIQAFSSPGTDPTLAGHFDDFIAYRRIEELIREAGVAARDWPEEATTTTLFNRAAVESAVGGPVTSGSSVGQVSVTLVGVVASGIGTGGTSADVTFVEAADASWAGIGVAGGGSALIQSSANEFLRLDLERASKFAVTLADFGIYSGDIYEIAQFRFYNGGVEVAGSPKYGVGCNTDGSGVLASFSMDVGAVFDRVDIVSFPALDLSTFTLTGITAFLVSEIKACPSSEATCDTSLKTAGNTCTVF